MKEIGTTDSTRKGSGKESDTSLQINQALCVDNRRFGNKFPAITFLKVERLCTMLPGSTHWPLVWTLAFLLIYFFLMDCRLYQTLQNWSGGGHHANATSYSPFKPLTMKLLMLNYGNHYVLMPLAEYFDEYSKFSKRFPFITANMISFTHVVVCLISFRMLYSDNIVIRRAGCLVFQLRNWLDGLDGVVHRSHAGTQFKLKSYRNTSGYLVDAFADTLSGCMESLAIYIYLLKNPPTSTPSKCGLLPWTKPSENSRSRKEFSKWELFRPCLLYGLLVGVAGIFWDRYVGHFNEIMEFAPQNTFQKEQQLYQLKTMRMWIFIWLWRMINAQSLLDYGLIAIALDKTWPFLHIMQYFGWPIMIIVCMATEIQLAEVYSAVVGSS